MTRKRTDCAVRSDRGIAKIWTKDKALEAIALFHAEHGSVSRREYERLKAGDPRFPSAKVVIALFGGLRASLLLIGDKNRGQLVWSQEEDDFLRERVGTMTVKSIARRLGRSYIATRKRMFHLQIHHKDNDGRLTA